MKIKSLIMLGALLLAPTTAVANDGINVNVDGNVVSFLGQAPAIVEGRTLVPVRGVFEELGFDVHWNPDAQEVTLQGSSTIVLSIGSSAFTTNGVTHQLDVEALIINGSTMLPIRAVLESVGFALSWQESTSTVFIHSSIRSGTSRANIYTNQSLGLRVDMRPPWQVLSVFELSFLMSILPIPADIDIAHIINLTDIVLFDPNTSSMATLVLEQTGHDISGQEYLQLILDSASAIGFSSEPTFAQQSLGNRSWDSVTTSVSLIGFDAEVKFLVATQDGYRATLVVMAFEDDNVDDILNMFRGLSR